MFQVSHSICTFSVSGEFGLAEPEETLWSMPLEKRLASQLCLLLDYFIKGNLWNVDKLFAVFISISFHCGKIHPLKTSGGIPSNTRNVNKRTWKHTHSSLFKNHGSFCWAFGVTWFGFAASPVREMEQQKLFSGCLLRTHCWPIMGFGSSLTRICETNDLALAVFPCRLSGLQWHSLVILILEARKKSLMKHSGGSAKHEAIMKLQHSHVVLAGGCTVQTHWSHCRTGNTGSAIEMPMPL